MYGHTCFKLEPIEKALDMNTDTWEDLASDRSGWRSTLHAQLQVGETKLTAKAAEQRARKKHNAANKPTTTQSDKPTTHACNSCGKDCHSHIGLFSHRRRCTNQTT